MHVVAEAGSGLEALNNFENIAPTSHPFGQIYSDIEANILPELSYHVSYQYSVSN